MKSINSHMKLTSDQQKDGNLPFLDPMIMSGLSMDEDEDDENPTLT